MDELTHDERLTLVETAEKMQQRGNMDSSLDQHKHVPLWECIEDTSTLQCESVLSQHQQDRAKELDSFISHPAFCTIQVERLQRNGMATIGSVAIVYDSGKLE